MEIPSVYLSTTGEKTGTKLRRWPKKRLVNRVTPFSSTHEQMPISSRIGNVGWLQNPTPRASVQDWLFARPVSLVRYRSEMSVG